MRDPSDETRRTCSSARSSCPHTPGSCNTLLRRHIGHGNNADRESQAGCGGLTTLEVAVYQDSGHMGHYLLVVLWGSNVPCYPLSTVDCESRALLTTCLHPKPRSKYVFPRTRQGTRVSPRGCGKVSESPNFPNHK